MAHVRYVGVHTAADVILASGRAVSGVARTTTIEVSDTDAAALLAQPANWQRARVRPPKAAPPKPRTRAHAKE